MLIHKPMLPDFGIKNARLLDLKHFLTNINHINITPMTSST